MLNDHDKVVGCPDEILVGLKEAVHVGKAATVIVTGTDMIRTEPEGIVSSNSHLHVCVAVGYTVKAPVWVSVGKPPAGFIVIVPVPIFPVHEYVNWKLTPPPEY